MNLFDLIEAQGIQEPVKNDDWRPVEPPCLDRIHEIYLNCETTGLRWFDGDRPISIALYAGDRSYYLPWGHRGLGNLSEETVKRWALTELKGKHIINFNTRFDIHQMREWGVDLEAQGNTVSDVGHYAALLDDHRLRNNLDGLIHEFLHETPMPRIDESKMRAYSAGAAAPRSMYGIEAVKRLKDVFWPMLEGQDLQRVRALEDKIIYIVCEMEKNGAILNQELLEQWIIETKEQYYQGIMKLYKETGLKINPGSSPDTAKLFRKLDIPITEYTEPSSKFPHGQPSFPDEVLKVIKHPTVILFRHTKKLGSLHSKLKSYRDSIDSKGILRYAMHQMRTSKSETDDSGDSGTIVGRFTSSEITPGFGVNIQQVMNPEKQILSFGDEFFIRNLFVPSKGMKYLSADAEQVQYRIAADKAKNARILAKYKEDPWMSYHKMMWGYLRQVRKDISYKRTKDTNFANQFGAGLRKIAFMIGEISKKELKELLQQKAGKNHPKLLKTAEFLKIYDREFPEISKLLKEYENIAIEQGFITDIIGRRMTFPDGDRTYKAFNGYVIMSEASIVKQKLVEVHEERKITEFLLRAQVHDEVDGDIPDDEHGQMVADILNRQSFPELEIPILWGMSTGTSWGDCSRDKLDEIRKELLL